MATWIERFRHCLVVRLTEAFRDRNGMKKAGGDKSDILMGEKTVSREMSG